MGTETFPGRALMLGYDWTIQLELTPEVLNDPPYFPAGTEVVAHVRYRTKDTNPLTTLSTFNQKITRVSDSTISITIPGVDSVNWTPGEVVMDLARVDDDPDTYVGVKLTIPTKLPVTRGLEQP